MPPKPTAPKAQRETAETMAGRQKEIAVSEFFAKNRHLLGFDNARKALLTTVKEAVDNSLDACEEAGILPEIWLTIEALNGGSKSKSKAKDEKVNDGVVHPDVPPEGEAPSIANATRFRVTVRDNGPGIVKAQIPNVFGRLLYGSKFHRLRMSRGQQGIGISAAGMYGLLTTGQSVQIISKTGPRKPAHRFELQMDTLKNRPDITVDEEVPDWHEAGEKVRTGTQVSIVLEAKFQRGRASVDEYVEQTAIANPHALVHYAAPDGVSRDFPREVDEVPASPAAIKPHPYGVELGVLIRMLKETDHHKLGDFLQNEFSRVSPKVVKEITAQTAKLTPLSWCSGIGQEDVDELHQAIQNTKIQNPPTDCLVPIGPQQILKGLLKEIKAEFYTAETREPAVYRGNPFQIEVGIAFGGDLPGDQPARVIRYANRVPLLYQPSACSITKAVAGTNWKQYGLGQPRNGLPEGPLVVFVHMASVWVPFTSESKEAIADYDEIRKEIQLALKECGRKLNTYIRRRQKIAREGQRRDVFTKYIGEVVAAVAKINALDESKQQSLHAALLESAKQRTAQADVQFDEDGNPLPPKPAGGLPAKLAKDENVVLIEAAAKVEDAEEPDEEATDATEERNASGELFHEQEAA